MWRVESWGRQFTGTGKGMIEKVLETFLISLYGQKYAAQWDSPGKAIRKSFAR